MDALILERSNPEALVYKWPKDEHLKSIRGSGLFRFTKEIVFHHQEACDAKRYVGFALSQGGLQTALKSGWIDLYADIEAFQKHVEQHFRGKTLDVLFSYRMRVGVK